ncbi:MAG: FAD-dependent oxidoreductase, partial [Clostridia bacterium]|nr:FAD-dependent oxidoreductase [Clostridia bacterium]
MIYQKTLVEKYDVDVFVAGGGAAGVAAAIAAARGGKTVFLAESTGCFGGLGTSGMVPSFAPFDDGVNV